MRKRNVLVLSCLLLLSLSRTFAQDGSVKVLTSEEVEAMKNKHEIPLAAENLYNEGIAAYQAKNYTGAVQKYSEAINIYADFSAAYFNRGLAHLGNGNKEAAAGDFTKTIALDVNSHQAMYELSVLKIAANELEAANELLKKAVLLEPAVNYYYQKGIVNFMLKDYEQAKNDFSATIQQDAAFAFAYNDRGSVNRELGKLDDAIADYKKAVELNPELKTAYNNLGSAYRKKGDQEKAIAAYSSAIKLDPGFYLAYNNRGYAKFEKGDYEGAISDFQAALKIKPDYAFAYNNMGGAYLKLQKYKDAVAACDKAIAINADYGYAYYNRGAANEMLREMSKACQDWQKAAELGVESANTYFNNSDCNNQ